MFTAEEVVRAYKTIGYKPTGIAFRTITKECCPLGALYIYHNGVEGIENSNTPGYIWARDTYFNGSSVEMSDFFISFDRAFRESNWPINSQLAKEVAEALKEMS